MNNDELKRRVKNAYYNLNSVKTKLDSTLQMLEESIVINKNTFGGTSVKEAKTKVNNQMYTLNTKVLKELNK